MREKIFKFRIVKFFNNNTLRLFILIIFSTSAAYASSPDSLKKKVEWTAKNAIFIEFWGIDGMEAPISFNYDRILFNKDWFKTSIRIGGNIPQRTWGYFNSFPLLVNFIFGRRAVCFELGIGGVLLYEDLDYKTPSGAVSIGLGLRYQKPNGGLFVRAGLTPTIGYFGTYLWAGGIAGASIGYSF